MVAVEDESSSFFIEYLCYRQALRPLVVALALVAAIWAPEPLRPLGAMCAYRLQPQPVFHLSHHALQFFSGNAHSSSSKVIPAYSGLLA